MENQKIIWDFIKVVIFITVAIIPVWNLFKVIISKQPIKIIRTNVLISFIGIIVSILGFVYLYNGNIKSPENFSQSISLITITIIGVLSFCIILIPYYRKRSWKNKIPIFIIGISAAVLALKYLYY
ncbi:hypothetical protein SAMN04487989_101440 [Bizionia echini]|uniref:Uncharacterized protein n=1 Tax=Bizionia echini TaxID=649333 RepID=A0A1I4Z1E8_9FLAO|nr:hypothetical protein [Bizionia echini]SFN44072.1 hypothetical protein SAMN04487989_101440 [Bizionia echini]